MNRKQKRLIALGALVLALAIVSGVVLYSLGGGDGYEACVSALKTFLFECDNYTLDASAKLALNGQILEDFLFEASYSKDAAYTRTQISSPAQFGKAPREEIEYYMDGVRYYGINETDKTYNSYETVYGDFLSIENTELSQRMFDLWKLLVDFLAGDAKNNVIKLGKTGDETEYQLRLSEKQLPQVVKLLTSISGLVFDEQYDIGYDRVIYEDKRATFAAWYLRETGEALPGDFYSLVYDNSDLYAAYNARCDDMDAEYEALLDAQPSPCILYVAKDGASTPYHDLLEYATQHDASYAMFEAPEGVSVAGLDKNGLYPASIRVSSVEANARIDAQNRPTACDLSVTLDIDDAFGVKHTLHLDAHIAASNYGETVPKRFNADGYTRKTYTPAAKESEPAAPSETIDVTFDGKTYEVPYTPALPLPTADEGSEI